MTGRGPTSGLNADRQGRAVPGSVCKALPVATAPSRRVLFAFVHRGGPAALATAAGAWSLLLALLLRHRLFASHDAINNYAHVWYAARELWHHHRLPLHKLYQPTCNNLFQQRGISPRWRRLSARTDST